MTIQSERLDLVLLTPEIMDALVNGRQADAERLAGITIPPDWPNEHDARFLRFRLQQVAKDGEHEPFLARAIALRDAGRPRRRLGGAVDQDVRAVPARPSETPTRGAKGRPIRPMIGHIGFHGKPGVNAPKKPGAVELGYTVFADYRRRGYAEEANRALIRWARDEHGVRTFIASVSPENAPSLALVRKLGFVQIGRHWDDEDGEELEFELQVD